MIHPKPNIFTHKELRENTDKVDLLLYGVSKNSQVRTNTQYQDPS